ncbi:hypothetical protein BDZ88DRAFT_422384 [Geranomyces variabilis]|nr:hypothetical protein BDZ88DRAFT_422384 [Geranomyces variabilis]
MVRQSRADASHFFGALGNTSQSHIAARTRFPRCFVHVPPNARTASPHQLNPKDKRKRERKRKERGKHRCCPPQNMRLLCLHSLACAWWLGVRWGFPWLSVAPAVYKGRDPWLSSLALDFSLFSRLLILFIRQTLPHSYPTTHSTPTSTSAHNHGPRYKPRLPPHGRQPRAEKDGRKLLVRQARRKVPALGRKDSPRRALGHPKGRGNRGRPHSQQRLFLLRPGPRPSAHFQCYPQEVPGPAVPARGVLCHGPWSAEGRRRRARHGDEEVV